MDVTMEMTTQRRKLTQPLEWVVVFFGRLMLFAILAGVGFTVFGSGSIFGFGSRDVCAIQPRSSYSNSDWTLPRGVGLAPRPGTSIGLDAPLQACVSHPGLTQRTLSTLENLPGWLVWCGILLLLWQIIRSARRDGPFTPQVAAAMWRLGWLILVGSVVAGAVNSLATDQLLATMLTGSHPSLLDPVAAAVRALVPVPALTGAALLTFARIVKLGAAMDDEIKGTV